MRVRTPQDERRRSDDDIRLPGEGHEAILLATGAVGSRNLDGSVAAGFQTLTNNFFERRKGRSAWFYTGLIAAAKVYQDD